MHWQELVYLILSTFEYHPEFETFETSLRPLAINLGNAPHDVRSLAYILDSFYKFHADTQGISCQRWGDKTPMNIFVLDSIFNVFPNAQFLHIVRDGCDVVSSFLEAGRYATLEEAAERWNSSISLANSFIEKHPRSCIEVRYEKLVSEPEATARLISSFLDVEYDNAMIQVNSEVKKMGDVPIRKHHENVAKDIFRSSVGKGRNKLTVIQKEKLQNLIGTTLSEMNYEPCID